MRKFLSVVRWLVLLGLCTAMSPRVLAQQSVPVSWQSGLSSSRPSTCNVGQGWISTDIQQLYVCVSGTWSSVGGENPPSSSSTVLAAPAQGLVQSATGQNGTDGAIPAVALVNNVAAGNMLLACEAGVVSTTPTVSVTDTLGNSWTALPAAGQSGATTPQIQCFMATAAASGADSAQFTISGTASYITVFFAEYTGVNTFDQAASAAATSSGNIATTHNNEMLVAIGTSNLPGNGVYPLMQPGAGYALRAPAVNGTSAGVSIGSLLEDGSAPTSGTYSASFNQGGYNTGNAYPLIQLLSFYSSSAPQPSFRPLAWSDLPSKPLNLNCNNFSFELGCFSMQSPLSIGDVPSRISFYTQSCNEGIFNSSNPLYSPICIEVPTIQSGDEMRLMWLAAGGNSTNCVSGWRIDGDGYFVWDGSCGLALTMPLTQIFGELRISNSQDTAEDDLLIGPSAAKTGGAVIADMYDSADTEFFKAPDLESVSNPPQFPIGATFSGGPVVLSKFTVSTLPSASTWGAGAMVIVTDATTFTVGTCTGGGSDTMIAVSNGSTWSCH